MLKELTLSNVGPAPEMHMELAERVNLMTGDNGLGKSFLLDVAWYALTRRWPQDINGRMTSGFAAKPRNRKKPATIEFSVAAKSKNIHYETKYSPRDESWLGKPGRPWFPGLVIYAHADGSLSVWDPARNYWRKKGAFDVQERFPAFTFTEPEVWSGLRANLNGNCVVVCKGLLDDWSTWIKSGDENSKMMDAALKSFSISQQLDGVLESGPNLRMSVSDARDIPSLLTSYAGVVPILHASAGVRRMVALAYMLTWSWQEHIRATEQLGEEPTRRVIMLFDEVESHLHPRWQRTILRSLRDLVKLLRSQVEVQLILATHSPLVIASAEPWFDPEKDAWFDLDLCGNPPSVELRRREYTLRGTAGNWLTSEAFDLKTDRGSIEAEQAVLHAEMLQSQSNVELDEIMKAHCQLRRVLPDLDTFWVRWCAFVEDNGGDP